MLLKIYKYSINFNFISDSKINIKTIRISQLKYEKQEDYFVSLCVGLNKVIMTALF